MDTKITLSFDESVIVKAKKYAENNNISLSRLIEFLLQKITSSNYQSLEDFPISQWVSQVAEGEGRDSLLKLCFRNQPKSFQASQLFQCQDRL